MYVTHHPDDHTAWKERRAKEKKQRQLGTDSSSLPETKDAASKKNLTLSDSLKAAMIAKFRCSEDDASKLWSDVVKSSN